MENGIMNIIQKDKELLLKDLSARLPYNCRVFYEYVDDLDGKTYGYSLTLNTWCIDEFVANKAIIKPYLRPLSSMTEKEVEEFVNLQEDFFKYCKNQYVGVLTIAALDWLNAHHFDYRNLIEKGLALEAPKEMYYE